MAESSPASAPPSRTFPFGAGSVLITPDGAVSAVQHPVRDHSMLLDDDAEAAEAVFHEPARRWGKGFVVTDQGSHRFDDPAALRWIPGGVEVLHRLGALELTVTRVVASSWTETYELRNVSATPVTVGSIAVSTPWRDVYFSARDSLRRAVHAHVWTGGSDSWVWAVPMDGSGPGLGLVLTEGELWSYSVESRDQFTSSNIRGHLYLHVTDHARSPGAMGGQPEIVLAPGESYRWSWRLDWYDSLADLHLWRSPLVEADLVTAEVGQAIALRVAPGTTVSEPLPLLGISSGFRELRAERAGVRSRTTVYFHPPLRELVERRVRFVLDHQRPTERADSRRGAFVPYDNESGLRVLPGAWGDWSDARERVGTALMLQETRAHGWADRNEVDDALAAYELFVTDHVVAADGTVSGDNPRVGGPRLYNFPWYARFLLGQGDLERAVSVMDRYYALGGDHFLAFELGPVLIELAGRLEAAGRTEDAVRLRGYLQAQARTFLGHGEDLPAHEVNYEQSMVAPLVDLLLSAYRLDPESVPAAELDRRLRWLQAFAADQPDARLRHVPIRHWDGYWFGALRMWGDVFPHYWSILSAGVFLSWPEELADPARIAELRSAGYAILRANLTSFRPDGSATCAFIYPSCVNGRPAHRADPLANDQDWALVYALRHGLSIP